MATRTWTNNAAPYLEAATLAAMEVDIAAAGKPLTGPGIDLTGATDSKAAVQAFLNACTDGDTVTIPTAAVIQFSGPITVGKKLTINGSGEFRFTAGIAAAAAITVNADECVFTGFTITNPNALGDWTGGTDNRTKNYAVYVNANYFTADKLRVKTFQNGIVQSPFGVFHHFRVVNCELTDMLGAGGMTPGSTSGEDRGDGIYAHGTFAIITGNMVQIRTGQDGRIGIGLEYNPGRELTDYAYKQSHGIIANNHIMGTYRRSIAIEDVSYVVIQGNTCADPTYGGIWIIQNCHHCVIQGNTIRWTRPATVNNGGSPLRSGILIYDYVQNAIITGNNIHVQAGGNMTTGIGVNQVVGNSINCAIDGNVITSDGDIIPTGISILNGATNLAIVGNRMKNVKNGVTGLNCTGVRVNRNVIIGTRDTTGDSDSQGIKFQGSLSDNAQADDNVIVNTWRGVEFDSLTDWATVRNNVLKNQATGVVIFNSPTGTFPATISGNLFVGVTTKISGFPTGTIQVGNN